MRSAQAPQRNAALPLVGKRLVMKHSPEDYAADIDREKMKWSRIVRRSGAFALRCGVTHTPPGHLAPIDNGTAHGRR